MNRPIALSNPVVGEGEEAAILRAVRSGWVAPAGPEIDAFEREVAAAMGRDYAVALSSGTAALHLALLSLGVGPGDAVPTSSMTFAATANAITYVGAEPVFVDSDESGNMDPALLAAVLDTLADQGRRVGAVMPVDLLGKMADYERIMPLCAARGIPCVSDAAESLGAMRNGHRAGSFGDAAAVSFNGNKIITASGGGALVTDSRAIAERTRYLATQARQPVAHYEHTEIGFNYRMSNVMAALGRAQLARLEEFRAHRRRNRHGYRQLCDAFAGLSIFGGADDGDNCWLTAVLVDPEEAGFTAGELASHLAAAQIETRPLWKPMHLQPVFQDSGQLPAGINGTSERFFATGITLPSGVQLGSRDLRFVIEQVSTFARTHDLASRQLVPLGPPRVGART